MAEFKELAPTPEEFAAVAAQDPDVEILRVKIKGVGVVLVKPPSQGDYTRFEKKLSKEGCDRGDTFSELGRCCLAWPAVSELDAVFTRRRKFGAWSSLGAQAAKLAGMLSEEIEGN